MNALLIRREAVLAQTSGIDFIVCIGGAIGINPFDRYQLFQADLKLNF
jgi:hypothetical protein